MPNFDNLHLIIEELQVAATEGMPRKRRSCNIILADEAAFLKKLHELIDKAEDLQNYDVLFNIFYIYKNMISLGDSKLIETLVSKDFYLDTFAALEYDPDIYKQCATLKEDLSPSTVALAHRDFLVNKAKFKTIV